MNKVELIIFDMDGTLFDTSEGICDSYIQVARTFNKKIPEKKDLQKLIGGPLRTNLKDLFDFEDQECQHAIDVYRGHYAKIGLEKSKIYPGVVDTIRELHDEGYSLGVATLKRQDFAVKFIENSGLLYFFSSINGMDARDELTKEELIKNCMDVCGADGVRTIVVGDSSSDYNGALCNNTRFLAATWGFGFDEETCCNKSISYVRKFEDIPTYLNSHKNRH
jgi:Predicted phosphatases